MEDWLRQGFIDTRLLQCYFLHMNISSLSGIGEKRAASLQAAGLHTVFDLLNYFPRDYDDRSQIKTVAELNPNAVNTIRGVLAIEPENINPYGKRMQGNRPLTLTKAILKDSSGILELVWFNQPYLKKYFRVGQEYVFTGRVRLDFKNRLQMESPDYEIISETQLSAGRIVPVYTTPKGFSQKIFRKIIFEALSVVAKKDKEKSAEASQMINPNNSAFDENLPLSIRQAYDLCDRKKALINIHYPESDQAFMAARRRLVFEELFLMQMALLALKEEGKDRSGISLKNLDYSPLLAVLPFKLTSAQEHVLEDIKADFMHGSRMNRLIQGDVGSGKTAVAMIGAYLTIKNGSQAAIMAPTEVLAQQHFKDFDRYFGALGIKTVLLTGSLTLKERRAALEQIAVNPALMIVGTHALIQSGVEYARLGLVITDEQHRFGVSQRFMLTEKGDALPHTLVMTATPIPRTLALILYGDLDISIIDELPPGRQKIKTYCVDSRYRKRVHEFIRKEAKSGHQAYIICPAIEENQELLEKKSDESQKAQINNVLTYTQELSSALPELTISCLHGKMKPSEKQEIMDSFKSGKIHALVATTVVEVGVHAPNASLIIIENAERFGLSQLHQLRGRVGRGSVQSYCVLLTDAKNIVTAARMKAMVSTTDGFKLAELDLEQRGAGDFFGTRQHGLPDFRIANLYRDLDILKIAQSAAQKLHKGGIALSNEETEMIKSKVALVPIL